MDSANQIPDDEDPLEEDVDLDEGKPDEDEPAGQPPMHATAEPDFFQRQMHLENSRRLRRLETGHSKMMSVLSEIRENTKDLASIRSDVDELKEGRAKVKGALWVAMAGGPVLSWLAARFFKW